jgi:CTP:molybdopterin cytidylyltransferase MocA
MRRGHPWLVDQSLLPAISTLGETDTLRAFLAKHADLIDYLVVETPTILADLDTPADYDHQKPD